MPSKKTSPAPHPSPRERSILTPDSLLTFPEFFLLAASAGSGKTHALSLRFVQFLLSERIGRISRNDLPNILAITFTKNAAREMKDRILDWLKKCHSGDEGKIKEIQAVVSGSAERLMASAGECVDRILSRYSDFQVETIDSFTSSVFKASAVDLGISPDFEIVLEPSEHITYAFSRYLRKVNARSAEGRDFERILDLLSRNQKGEGAFAWDPAPLVRDMIGALDGKLSAQSKTLKVESLDREKLALERKLVAAAEEIEAIVEKAGLPKDGRGHGFKKILPAIRTGDFVTLIGASFKTPPVKSPPASPASARAAANKVLTLWARLESMVGQYRRLYVRGFYYPYLIGYRSFRETLELVKRQQAVVFIDDINKRLSGYLDQGIVPDIYFRLGDRIFHFLIDEFQDTSPMQWKNLVPLIENSLAQAGSLFVVGDTKQAIFGFRHADYRIMKELEEHKENPFESVEVKVDELKENYRCRREILDFVKSKFQLDRAEPGAEGAVRDEGGGEDETPDGGVPGDKDKYADFLKESHLDDFDQEVIDRKKDAHPGHVEYLVLDRKPQKAGNSDDSGSGQNGDSVPPEDEANGAEADDPERSEIQERVIDLHSRGFAYADIAVLAYKNESVVDVASWLNDKGIDFIAFSCLDIRQRTVIAEILKLLQFLDSPLDDLSFAAFLLGHVLNKKMVKDPDLNKMVKDPEFDRLPAWAWPGALVGKWHKFLFDCRLAGESPLYTAFRRRYPKIWDRYLERFFKIVGYYPLYDLVTLIFRMFDVFALFPEEEASLTRLLETIKDFEGQGRNDLREFLTLSGDDGGDASGWTIDVPPDVDAVRVMSIHKSKGLGFPAVILLLYGEGPHRQDFYFEQDEDSIRVLKLTKDTASGDAELWPIYEDAQIRSRVGSLNALYVAMTRASAELHIIGVKGKRLGYPFDFLGTKRFTSKDENGRPLGPKERPTAPEKEEKPKPPRAGVLRPNAWFELPMNTRETLNRDNIRRGEIAHALLAEVEYLSADGRAGLDEAASRLSLDADEAAVVEDVKGRLVRFIQGSDLRPYFEARPGRRVFTELEVCDRTGRERRLDRVVVDPGEVFVLEFKTGLPSEPGRRKERILESACHYSSSRLRRFSSIISPMLTEPEPCRLAYSP